jgi:colicin import membrane protein
MNTVAYRPSYQLPAGVLAVLVHGAFFALLYVGFAWQTQPPAAMSVTLWQSLPSDLPAPVVPVVEPVAVEAAPAPQPEIQAEPVQDQVKPDIVIPVKKPIAKVETAPPVVAAQTKKIEAKPLEKPVVSKPAEPSPAELQAAREQAERAAQAAARERVVAEFGDKIKRKVTSNIVMPPNVPDDARAEFAVTLLPGGSVLGAKLLKSSGNVAYDAAVERAILKSSPLPLPADASLFNRFRDLKLGFQPKAKE